MPIYEYECTQCGEIKEAVQSIMDKPLTKCSACSGKLNKLISQSTFHLKGSGWYVTDYGKNKEPAADKKNKKESTDKNKKDTTKEKSTADKSEKSAKKTSKE